MQSAELLRIALKMTDEATASLVKDMRTAPLTQPISRDGRTSGNHPLWILGHLAYIEGTIPRILFGAAAEANPLEHWAPLFAPGTEPSPDPAMYPSFDEVLGACRARREHTLRLLDELGDAGLERPTKAPPAGFEEVMRTIAHTLLVISLHQMVHYGQIADARRVAGRKPPL